MQIIGIIFFILWPYFRFDVNFQNDFEYNKSDLILHTSLRYSDGAGFIVNNSKNENGWMEEIMHRNIAFEPSVTFEILVLCDYDKYQVSKFRPNRANNVRI